MARDAYGESVETDLYSAIQTLHERPQRLERCMRDLQMTLPVAHV